MRMLCGPVIGSPPSRMYIGHTKLTNQRLNRAGGRSPGAFERGGRQSGEAVEFGRLESKRLGSVFPDEFCFEFGFGVQGAVCVVDERLHVERRSESVDELGPRSVNFVGGFVESLPVPTRRPVPGGE